MKQVIILLIKAYKRFISPFTPRACRFYPSCSTYALEAVTVHGALKGGFLAVKRILKCNPFHSGGVDHVPPKKEK